jgi:dihydroorotase
MPIADLGALGFKLFLNKPYYFLDIDDDLILVEAFKKIKKTNKILAVHAEDKAIIEDLKFELIKAGNSGIGVYHKAHPPKAEIQAVKRMISLVKKSLVKTHFCHISTHEALIDIVRAKAEGWKVSCEVTPHHLLLSNEAVCRLGNISIIDPPLRDEGNVKALWQGFIRGDIDLIATDHAPHTLNEKRNDNVWKVPPGAPGLETVLPLLLNMVNKGVLSLSRVVESLASTPARVFGLKGKGLIKEGFDADLTMVDLKKGFKIDPSNFHSKAKYSPFSGVRVLGSVIKTFIGGILVMEDGEVLVNPGAGNILRLE